MTDLEKILREELRRSVTSSTPDWMLEGAIARVLLRMGVRHEVDCGQFPTHMAAPMVEDSERATSVSEPAEKEQLVYAKPRNVGGHNYPGVSVNQGFVRTSDCDYCGCWMGGYRSGGPKGVDPFKDCPGNPRISTTAEKRWEASDELT